MITEHKNVDFWLQTYHVKEKATIYASSDAHRIEHMESAGDVDAGKAWRTVRRPSDMVMSFFACSTLHTELTSLSE